MSNKGKLGCGIWSIVTVIGIILIALKLLGILTWPWIIVLIPLLLPPTLVATILLIIFTFIILISINE